MELTFFWDAEVRKEKFFLINKHTYNNILSLIKYFYDILGCLHICLHLKDLVRVVPY